jgi:type VI secretion system protein ImpH
MATESGGADPPITNSLFEEAYRFEFFQAVRLLERLQPGKKSVGQDASPGQEVARFRTRASVSFPPSQIHEITRPIESDPPEPARMTVAFMGLTGPLGVLPAHYTEILMERSRSKDWSLWDFLDIFSHRMISLFYRAWSKYRFPVAYERGEDDRFTEYLSDLINMGFSGLRKHLSVPDEALLFYGGLIAQRPHSASAIEAILGDFFAIPVRVDQFLGQWLSLDDESLSLVGVANSELGLNSVAGTRIWDDQSKFRVIFGPLTLNEFQRILPSGPAFGPAVELTRLLAGMEFDFDVQPVLKAAEVPRCILTTRARRSPMLGWTTWLYTGRAAADDSQVVLLPGKNLN